MSSSSIERGGAVQLSCEQKATLDEMMKKAEVFMESEEVQNQCRLAVITGKNEDECVDMAAAAKLQFISIAAGGFLENETKGPLNRTDYHIYAGYYVSVFPSSLAVGSAGASFVVAGTDVEAAVVYSGKNKAGVSCSWIFGFLADSKDAAKVYVACGQTALLKIDWADIKKKIESGGSIGYDVDAGVFIIGQIKPGCTAGNYNVGAYYALA